MWDDENYYLISNYEKHEGITYFGVDKMEYIEILDVKSIQNDCINIGEYAKKIFSMFDNSLLGVVIYRFGKNTIIQKSDENDFIAYIKKVTIKKCS